MRRHLPFLLILVATAIARFVILFVSQTHVTSDEAIIGLMGKHILEGRAFPFYFLFIPALIIFFLIIEKENIRRARDFFFFGLICGIAFWSMELLLITI